MITTHILDTSQGCPARGVVVRLELLRDDAWIRVGEGVTDGDGRLRSLTSEDDALEAGTYRLRFDTAAYFAESGTPTFYPYVEIAFTVPEGGQHFHVPLLLNPFGYSTYRGS
jgi:5-hydroxyisourate hydrolase